MTAKRACEGSIKVLVSTGPDVYALIGEVTSWSLDETANTKSYFKIGNCQEQTGVTGISRNIKLEGNYDNTDAGQPSALKIGETITVDLYPLGEDSDLEKYHMVGVVESLSKSGAGDDFVTFSLGMKVNEFTASVLP